MNELNQAIMEAVYEQCELMGIPVSNELINEALENLHPTVSKLINDGVKEIIKTKSNKGYSKEMIKKINELKDPKVKGAIVVYKERIVCDYYHIVGVGYVRDIFANDSEKYVMPYEKFFQMISAKEYTAKAYEGIRK